MLRFVARVGVHDRRAVNGRRDSSEVDFTDALWRTQQTGIGCCFSHISAQSGPIGLGVINFRGDPNLGYGNPFPSAHDGDRAIISVAIDIDARASGNSLSSHMGERQPPVQE
jgi:hypothetical protein